MASLLKFIVLMSLLSSRVSVCIKSIFHRFFFFFFLLNLYFYYCKHKGQTAQTQRKVQYFFFANADEFVVNDVFYVYYFIITRYNSQGGGIMFGPCLSVCLFVVHEFNITL